MRQIFLLLAIFIFNSSIQASELVPPTDGLNGIDITYNYTSGRSYNVKFQKSGISYRFLTGSKPNKWWGPFPYKAFETTNNIYLASWYEEGYEDYVTLLINFNNNTLYGSAILAGKNVHFHGANIVKVQRK